MRFSTVFVLVTIVALSASSAVAQQRAPINEPYIKGTGATVPDPSAVAADGVDKNLHQKTPEERRQDAITNGICKGC